MISALPELCLKNDIGNARSVVPPEKRFRESSGGTQVVEKNSPLLRLKTSVVPPENLYHLNMVQTGRKKIFLFLYAQKIFF